MPRTPRTCYTARELGAILEGLDTLRMCSEHWSSPPSNLDSMLDFMHNLDHRRQCALTKVISIVLGTQDWPGFEEEALENEDFEISVLAWVVALGPRGLVLGRLEGKNVAATLLAAEEKWIVGHEEKDGYARKKQALRCFAEGVLKWRATVAEGGW
ncbi:hypothetical protein BDW02DRAFT_504553 [Decorospora gaudefroyi]|uniref:Uncharacterized protein n=1 Tax=Decorospora gaudefroyi TaxID=184978 RepID=A0A6A5KAH4_9PLEO|nr:hypothetical protein BDW02DRAFT_504553 [Decorospora gaudefroyi]